MKMNKKILLTAATAAIGLGAIGAGAGVMHAAASTSTSGTNPMTSLVQAIASKFNLNVSDVQAVVDQQKTTMQAQRAADEKTRLDKAVTAGTITQAQEDLIIAKQAEEKTFMDSLKSMSATDRQAAMKTHMAALKQWATDNKIPEQFAHLGGPGGRRGMGGPGHGPDDATAPATTPSASATPAS